MERFPSGQREQTVNLLSVTSVVRIHPSPPRKSTSQDVLFSCSKRVDLGYFSQNSRTLCVPNHLSVLTASKERCKRLHLQISCAADIDGGCTHRVQFAKQRLCKQSNRRRRRLSSLLCHNSADCLLAIQAEMCFFRCKRAWIWLFLYKTAARFACRTTFRC